MIITIVVYLVILVLIKPMLLINEKLKNPVWEMIDIKTEFDYRLITKYRKPIIIVLVVWMVVAFVLCFRPAKTQEISFNQNITFFWQKDNGIQTE